MSKRKDTAKALSATTATAEASAPEVPIPATEQPVSMSEPVTEAMAADSAVSVEAPKPIEAPEPTPKLLETPRPVEMAFRAIEAMRPAAPVRPAPEAIAAPQLSAAPVQEPDHAPVQEQVAAAAIQSRSHRFALLAASVALAGAVGAMAGTLSAVGFARPEAPAQTPMAALDLTSVQDSIAGLRNELSSIANMRAELSVIKAGLDSSTRNTNAQFAKFNERIDRAQAAPAAQLKQAMDAIERLERRVQTMGQAAETTGTVRPQAVAATPATPPAAPAVAEAPNVLDGWVVRHVSRGVAVIQGRRMGMIEVEPGDVVPGVGRIESIRRQDGRWVVVTSKGTITSPQPR